MATLTPAKIYLCKRDGSNPIELKEAIPCTSDAIEMTPPVVPRFEPIEGTFSFRIYGDVRNKIRALFNLPPHRWPRLTYKTIRANCAKRNR